MKFFASFLIAALVLLFAPQAGSGRTAGTMTTSQTTTSEETTMELTSNAFEDGGTIPARHTCRGENISPALAWRGAPGDTKSFALIVEDPDAPKGTFTHWVAYNIPADKDGLPADLPLEAQPNGLMQGRNDFDGTGYGGPCPPSGHGPHRYIFRLYALDAPLDLAPGADKIDVKNAMSGHVLDQTALTGQFEIE